MADSDLRRLLDERGAWMLGEPLRAAGASRLSVIVGTSGLEAFRWTSGDGMSALGLLPGFDSSGAYGVSGDGSVVVGTASRFDPSAGTFVATPFIWDATNGTRSLPALLTGYYGVDLTGWTLNEATGVSGDGRTIVGNGTNPASTYPGGDTAICEASGTSGFVAFRNSSTFVKRSESLSVLPSVGS
jgi:uncharacterized membrane protein